MIDTEELRGCPFCGSPATIFTDDVDWHVHCSAGIAACPAYPCVFSEDRAAAIARWNTRTPAADELDRLRALSDAACAFIDCNVADHDLTSEMAEKFAKFSSLRKSANSPAPQEPKP